MPDEAWRQFVMRLERESPQFTSSRHVGQYRQRRERLAELHVDPRAIHGVPAGAARRLDADLADAYHHAAEDDVLESTCAARIAVPGLEGTVTITLSGVLG